MHQAAAINAISRKKHVIVSTSTASGKSVIYQVRAIRLLFISMISLSQVPIMRFLEGDLSATGLFVYPTKVCVRTHWASDIHDYSKALAQDQISALEQLLWACPTLRHVNVATYDGDTPQECRAGKRSAQCCLLGLYGKNSTPGGCFRYLHQLREFVDNKVKYSPCRLLDTGYPSYVNSSP